MQKHYSFRILVFLFLFANAFTVTSQNAPCYVVLGIPYAPDSLTAPIPSGVTSDDQWSGVINMGFPFCFFGTYYSQVLIGSNGSLSFNLVNANGYQTWPINAPFPSTTPSDLLNTINLPWQDLYPPSGGTIKYQILGVSPNRRFVVEYKNIPMMSCTNLLFSAQVILYESSNNIETHIANKVLCPQWNGGASIHAIQNRYGTLASVVPGRNGTQWTTTNEGVRWTPVCQCHTQAMPNIISGKVFRDDNSNCIQDVGESGLANRLVRIGPWPLYLTTDTVGYYVMHVDTGTFNIRNIVPPYNSQLCPANDYNATFSSSPLTFTGNFSDSIYPCHDISVGVSPSWQRPCSTGTFQVQICNNGPLPAYNVVLTLTLPDSTFLISPLNYFANPGFNIYQYSFDTIQSNQCIYLTITDSVDCNVTVGSTLCYIALVLADSVDCDFENNWAHECVTVSNPMDPNEKLVASQQFANNGYVTYENITAADTLMYKINFQNTGTDTAFNVVIADTISYYLDPGTIRVVFSSDPYIMTISGNIVVFSFNNIMLPDSNVDEPASHGSIKYTIMQRPGNMPGTIIQNGAAIYFDVNLPVLTNQTENIIPSGTTGIHDMNNPAMKIYPNPFTGTIHIKNENRTIISSVTIFNSLGTIIAERKSMNVNEVTFDLSAFPMGIYFVKVIENERMTTRMIVRM
jgi:uncharacterized repeat protein (TIGR01451 family)